MFSNLRQTVAAIACTIVMSATCVLGAVAPAHADQSAPVSAARIA